MAGTSERHSKRGFSSSASVQGIKLHYGDFLTMAANAFSVLFTLVLLHGDGHPSPHRAASGLSWQMEPGNYEQDVMAMMGRSSKREIGAVTGLNWSKH